MHKQPLLKWYRTTRCEVKSLRRLLNAQGTCSALLRLTQKFIRLYFILAVVPVLAIADEAVREESVIRQIEQLNSSAEDEGSISPALKWKRAIDQDNGRVLWQLLSEVDVKGTNDKGKTALMAAAKMGDQPMLEALVSRGLSVEDKSLTGGTALMYAVLGNQSEMIRYLLPKTKHLDAQSTNGWTAVMIAAAKGFDTALAQLVAAGANANLADVYQWSPLMRAIDNKHAVVVEYLLLQPDIVIDFTNENGSSALHVAAQYGDSKTVARLLSLGVDFNLRDKNNASAKEVAITNGYLDIAALIAKAE